jgi:hypothetical protein
MATTIMMAKEYNKRPSEIMGITNDYLAYIFDETALFLLRKATDDQERINWDRIRWKNDKKNKSNKDLMEFIKKHNSKHR